MNQSEYRAKLRQLSTPALVDEIRLVRDNLRRRGDPRTKEWMTEDWQARELLAELGSRQEQLF